MLNCRYYRKLVETTSKDYYTRINVAAICPNDRLKRKLVKCLLVSGDHVSAANVMNMSRGTFLDDIIDNIIIYFRIPLPVETIEVCIRKMPSKLVNLYKSPQISNRELAMQILAAVVAEDSLSPDISNYVIARIHLLHNMIFYSSERYIYPELSSYISLIVSLDKIIFKYNQLENDDRLYHINIAIKTLEVICNIYSRRLPNVYVHQNYSFIADLECISTIQYFSDSKYSIGLIMALKDYNYDTTIGSYSVDIKRTIVEKINNINTAKIYYSILKSSESQYYAKICGISLSDFITNEQYKSIREDRSLIIALDDIYIQCDNSPVNLDNINVDVSKLVIPDIDTADLLISNNIITDKNIYLVANQLADLGIKLDLQACDICFEYYEIYKKKCSCSINYCIRCIAHMKNTCTVCTGEL